MYRKLLVDENSTYNNAFLIKGSGKWVHEDDFSTKYLNKDYTIVTTSAHSKNDIIDRVVEDVYFPQERLVKIDFLNQLTYNTISPNF